MRSAGEILPSYCFSVPNTRMDNGRVFYRRLEAEVRTALEYRESALFSVTEVH